MPLRALPIFSLPNGFQRDVTAAEEAAISRIFDNSINRRSNNKIPRG
jgi:hypothetical protein